MDCDDLSPFDLAVAEWYAKIRYLKRERQQRMIDSIYALYSNIPCHQPFCPRLITKIKHKDDDVTDSQWYCINHGGWD